MPKKKKTTDAVDILHRRYFEGQPQHLAELEEARASAKVARQIYDLRTQAGLTQRELAKLVATSHSVISRATGGGVWKTADGGKSWKPVSDGFFGGSIGAVAVSEWDSNVVYAGGGEKTVRGNVSHGGGVWQSTDAGKTWTHTGLADSRRIPRIRIHPKDPDLE